MSLSERIATVLAIDPSADAVEHDGRWTTWAQLAGVAEGVRDLVTGSGVRAPAAVGVLMANQPSVIGATLGVLLAEGCVVTLSPHQGDAGLAGDLRDLRPPIVVGPADQWERPGVRAAAAELGVLAVVVGTDAAGGRAEVLAGEEGPTVTDPREAEPGVAVEMLTSGTTGPPKRVPLHYAAFEKTIDAAQRHYRTQAAEDPDASPRLASGVALVASPLVHMSGIFRVLLNVCEGRRIALLDRFRVEPWAELVARHRPRAVSLVPTALRMVYDADLDPELFASVKVVTSGSAALDPDLQQRFEERYGVAVLPSYGATEFAGGVAGWTLPLHQEWGERKRGSVGRPQPGREVRTVDLDTGAEVATGAPGVLEVRVASGEWVRTTDRARIDADGFVWIDGRLDDAILRGGFKVFPKEVADALRSHPAVLDAGVVGMPDERLGSVPVAAVELRSGAEATVDELVAHCADHLTRYQVPARLLVVDALPRTPSMKVSGPGVSALFQAPDADG